MNCIAFIDFKAVKFFCENGPSDHSLWVIMSCIYCMESFFYSIFAGIYK